MGPRQIISGLRCAHRNCSDHSDKRSFARLSAEIKAEEAALVQRYEREIMNPEEALSLGSISEIVMPSELRRVLARQLAFCLRHYEPGPMQSVQREFH